MNDFGLPSRNKSKLIYGDIGENPVRVVSEAAKSFGAKKPGEKRILVAHSIGYRMDSHNTRALGEVFAIFCSMKGRRFSDVGKLAGIEVVNTPRITTPKSFWPHSARN